jgi:hypothetical protein
MTSDEWTPAAAFSALADARRLEIIRALDAASGRCQTFSALHEAVGVDDSGQFNYHLSRLRPHFVEKAGEGYRLTAAGRQVVRAVAAGRFTADVRFDEFEHDSVCHRCETHLCVSYRDERLRFRCPCCDEVVLNVGFPSSGVRERSPGVAVDAFARFSYHRVSQARDGVCPDCSGPTDGTVTDDVPPSIDKPAAVVFECDVCRGAVVTSFGGVAIYDPRVRSFHRERGVDLRDGYYWEVPQCLTSAHTTVESTNPWQTTVRFPVDGDACLARFEEAELVTVDVEQTG